MATSEKAEETAAAKRSDETWAFLFLALLLFPILAIVSVGGFGFIVWMQHLMFGPPGS